MEFFGGYKINIMTLDNLKNWISSGNHSKEISKLIDRRIVVNAFLNALEKINFILREKKIIENSLEEINDINQLEKIEKDFFDDPELYELDLRANSLYKASFNFFIKYKNETYSNQQ
ncbi:hypothetical protein CU321_01970 [Prochlorococcus marinus str. MU1412]|nr:hypothetical protein [Prochlorococcus marinus str. MU1412]